MCSLEYSLENFYIFHIPFLFPEPPPLLPCSPKLMSSFLPLEHGQHSRSCTLKENKSCAFNS